MERFYNAAAEIWVGRARKAKNPWPIPTEPPLEVQEATDRSKRPLLTAKACRVLGGHGLGIEAGSWLDMRFLSDAIQLVTSGRDGPVLVPYNDIVAFEIGGPGAQKTGGRFIGGGFGLEGAAEGMLIASALNLLTTRTKINTVICLQTRSSELFAHNNNETPDALRIRLSQVFNILRSQEQGQPPPGSRDPIEQLERLAQLRDSGVLSEEEFQAARAPLARRLAEGSSPAALDGDARSP